MEGALVSGQGQPWMYDVLALSMQIAGRPKADVERALLSHVDFSATDVPTDALLGRVSRRGSARRSRRSSFIVRRRTSSRRVPKPTCSGCGWLANSRIMPRAMGRDRRVADGLDQGLRATASRSRRCRARCRTGPQVGRPASRRPTHSATRWRRPAFAISSCGCNGRATAISTCPSRSRSGTTAR